METEAEKQYVSSERRSQILKWTIIAGCFLLYYSIMSMVAPGRKYRELREIYSPVAGEKKPVDERILTDSAFLALLKEKSFLQSRVTLAESDSIYLAINLQDSTANLEINGVSVHQTRIARFAVSRILSSRNNYIVLSMLSAPLTVNRNFASIEKEPLMIKLAPRDTSEYEPDIIPDTADYEPVNYIMEMDNGTRLFVYQEEKLKPGDGMRLFLFDLRYRIRFEAARFARIITFRVPEYHPFIKLRIPRSDAKIIYRALPEHGQVAVSS